MPRLVNDIWGRNVVEERLAKYNIKYMYKAKQKERGKWYKKCGGTNGRLS